MAVELRATRARREPAASESPLCSCGHVNDLLFGHHLTRKEAALAVTWYMLQTCVRFVPW
jgi:hypothetical protein